MKIILAFVLMMLPSLTTVFSQNAPVQYIQQIEAWQKKRDTSLKADNGWLNLAGLYWLQPGENSFGTGRQNKIVFPEGSIAAQAGVLDYNGTTVSLKVTQADITIDGKPVKDAIVFHPDSLDNPVMASGSLRWSIIKRENLFGIRLHDLSSKKVQYFKGIDHFTIDSNWRVKATLRKPAIPVLLTITNVLGQTGPEASPGKLMFTINGHSYALDALEEDGELFILFADETSGRETYASGRFLRAAMPGPDGTVILDFNKAYNPPCAFTPYATCPLPPKQNVLPIAITAGEKNYEIH